MRTREARGDETQHSGKGGKGGRGGPGVGADRFCQIFIV